MKYCTKCTEEKDLEQFYKNKARKDGYCNYCKDCDSQKQKDRLKNPKSKVKHVKAVKAWAANNKQGRYNIGKRWAADNRSRKDAQLGKAYAVRTNPNSVPDDFDLESTVPLYAERNRLTRETGVQHHVDHIVALANGGLHTADNLQVLTQEENLEKGNSR